MWCKKSPSPWILDQGSLLFTTNYVELWTTLKLSSSWTLSALKLLWSLIRYSTIKILLKKKKSCFWPLFWFLTFSCPSAGAWLSSSSVAALSRTGGGNTFSLDYRAEEPPQTVQCSSCSIRRCCKTWAAVRRLPIWGRLDVRPCGDEISTLHHLHSAIPTL